MTKDEGNEIIEIPPEAASPGNDDGSQEPKVTVVQASAKQIQGVARVARFRNRPMVMDYEPYPHFVPMTKERFESLAYPLLGGITRSKVNDIFSYLGSTAEDLTDNDHLILFGVKLDEVSVQAETDIEHIAVNKPMVWNSRDLVWGYGEEAAKCVWRSPHPPMQTNLQGEQKRVPFIMSLAGNDLGLYDDIMQSIAPMIMEKKPDGVIWWVGDGANGKSTLMDAIYKIFPGQLSSITVKSLADGRDTPRLNGTLANIVKESSEGRIEDTETYKAVGTHEDFSVHKFHSQDTVTIRGNLHHIFSANNIPTFNDKGFSARRRTFIVPFLQRFKSDPTFEERTFTPQMFGHLITEMCRYAKQIERQGYRYKWSAVTLAAKLEYDTDANNAEEYAKHIIHQGVVAFDSFNPVKMDYENWCADNGYVPLGLTNLRRAIQTFGFERMSLKEGESVRKIYRLKSMDAKAELQPLSVGRPGLFTIPGWEPAEPEVEVPDFEEPQTEEEPPAPPSILKGKW